MFLKTKGISAPVLLWPLSNSLPFKGNSDHTTAVDQNHRKQDCFWSRSGSTQPCKATDHCIAHWSTAALITWHREALSAFTHFFRLIVFCSAFQNCLGYLILQWWTYTQQKKKKKRNHDGQQLSQADSDREGTMILTSSQPAEMIV